MMIYLLPTQLSFSDWEFIFVIHDHQQLSSMNLNWLFMVIL